MNKRLIAPVASAIALFMFFAPWVSCGSMTWSGMDLASGNTGGLGDMGSSNTEPLLWAIPAASLAIIGLYFLFKNRWSSAIVPTIVIALVALAVMGVKYVDVSNKNKEATAKTTDETKGTAEDSLTAALSEGFDKLGSMMELKIEWGFWATGLMFLVVIVGATQYRTVHTPPPDVAATTPPYSGEPPTSPPEDTSHISQDRGMT